ncbi:MAG: fatty acid desaturase [Acidimicrobiia bacterium]|nr:fatty acid desaturase [Acidimicrobiia bacterium]
MADSMVPAGDLLVAPESDLIRTDGRPGPQWRHELRRIPNLANAASVVFLYVQTAAVVAVAVWLDNPLTWLVAFVLMGRAVAQFNMLMHEAAHRLLFSNKAVNDFCGRWILGYPVFAPTDLYRRGHMAHHREEFGPQEPDIALYRGYPIARASMRRKLLRDASGITGLKLMRGLMAGLVSGSAAVRKVAWSILATQAVIAAVFALAGHPWLYLFLWLLPYLTVWRVLNRLRSIAEHGGMVRSRDRRETTHSVRQHVPARFLMVPYHHGWHLAHHVDPGVPHRKLPALHEELVRSGYVQPGLEHRSYPALWRRLASGRSDGA